MNAPLILILLLLACLACGPHATAQGPYVKKWDRTLGGTTSEFTFTGRGQFDKARNSTLQFVLSYKLKLQNGEIPSFPNDKCGSFIDSWMLEIDSQGNITNSKLYCSSTEIGLVGSLDYRQYKLIIGMTNARRANDGSVVARNIGSSHDIWIVQVDSNFNEVDSWRMGGAMDDYLLYPTFLINGDTLYVAASVTSNWKNMPLQINGQITDMNYAAHLNYNDLAAKYHFTLDSEDTVYKAHITDVWFCAFSLSNKSVIWQKRLGGIEPEIPTALTRLSDGTFLLASSTASPQGNDIAEPPLGGFSDIWLTRVSAQGQLL